MRLFHITAVVLIALAGPVLSRGFGGAAWAGSGVPDAQAKESARQALDGREVLVRLYLDWKTDPKAYTILPVTLDGLDVTFDAVLSAYMRSEPATTTDPSGALASQQLANAVIVVTAEDQQDLTIADVLQDFIYADRCQSWRPLTLWPANISLALQSERCIFTDMLNQPIPYANVDILIGDYSRFEYASVKVWVTTRKLNAAGELIPPKSTSWLCSQIYVVNHPDCGPVPAQLGFWSGVPGSGRPFRVPALPREQWCVFLDALGNPIPGAIVDVFDGWAWSPADQTTEDSGDRTIWVQRLVDSIQLDATGGLRPPHARPLLDGCCFRVYDPNYGIALVEPYDKVYRRTNERLTTCVVPLVAAGTRADERSLWGTVVDPNGAPIPDALIKCSMIYTLGGGLLSPFFPGPTVYFSDKSAKVLTDSHGGFTMHVPLAKQDGTLGRPVPPGAQYTITIEAPQERGLAPYFGMLLGGQEQTITLYPTKSKPVSFSGTLVFVDEFGPVTDPARLEQVHLIISRKTGSSGEILYSGGWTAPKELPFGIYSPVARWDDKLYVFSPTQVAHAGPDTIVFVIQEIRPARKTFTGRVIHGITGAPVSQAIVLCPPRPEHVRAVTDDSQYLDDIYFFGPEIDPNSELFHILEQNPDLGITRTGPDGRYEITTSVEWTDSPDSILAIKEDFLGARQMLRLPLFGLDQRGLTRYEDFAANPSGKVPLPDMKLFPAATVLLEPNVPGESLARSETRFYYYTRPDEPKQWVKDLWATPSNNRGGSVFRTTDLRSNQLQSVYVPANVLLTLEVTRLDDDYAPVIIKNVGLTQGKVLDLGRVDFPPAMQVVVKVIDSAGTPLEGIMVQRLDEQGNRKNGDVTDSDGLARFSVPPHSQGGFLVEYLGGGSHGSASQNFPYWVGGYEDAQKQFILQLSDRLVQLLLGDKR